MISFSASRWSNLHHRSWSEPLSPFPFRCAHSTPLHLASITFLLGRGQTVELASYDNRLVAAAQALGVPIAPL